MNNNEILDQTLFSSKLKEAEIYADQGLVREAKEIYLYLIEQLAQMPAKYVAVQKRYLEEKYKELVRKNDTKTSRGGIKSTEPVNGKLPAEEIYERAVALIALELYDEALEEYLKLLNRNYRFFEVIQGIVRCYKAKQKRKDAISLLEKALKKTRLTIYQTDVIRFHLSLLYEDIGGYTTALILLNKIVKTDKFEGIDDRIKSLTLRQGGGTKFDLLLGQGMISHKALKEAVKIAKEEKKSVEFVLMDKFDIARKDIEESLSLYYGCPFCPIERKAVEIPEEVLGNLKYEYLKRYSWIPVEKNEDQITIAISDPLDIPLCDEIGKIYPNKKIKFFAAIKEDIHGCLDKHFGALNGEPNSIEDITKELELEYVDPEEEEVVLDSSLAHNSKVIQFVDQMIIDALNDNASDIHIEPDPVSKKTNIRFRIDGLCRPYVQIPNTFSILVISRIKIMAHLDISEKRLPLDGKILFNKKNQARLELRVATIPTFSQFEDVVLRLLGSEKALEIDKLMLSDANLAGLKKMISFPYGMILVVGPTGSGKTTTLHSALNYINRPDRKIWTAEEPIEIIQNGLRQVEVRPKIGLTFARILRSFLRADPDVIMIGEMRDKETASIGIEASLTGHLVLSTLHTNSAPETITRFLNMEIDPHNFADSMLGVLSQRLGRRLCPKCKIAYHPDEKEFNSIVEEYGEGFSKDIGIRYSDDLTLYKPKGCSQCDQSGYKGRIGLHELIVNNDIMKKVIRENGADNDAIKAAAVAGGMKTLRQDGIAKVFAGYLNLQEVKRVTI